MIWFFIGEYGELVEFFKKLPIPYPKPVKLRISCAMLRGRNGAETMEGKLVSKRQTPPIFYNVKILENLCYKKDHIFSYARWILRISMALRSS